MEVKTLIENGFSANCYVFENEKYLFIVDPGEFTAKLKGVIDLRPEKKVVILLTHGHFDHILGVKKIKDYTDACVVIGSDDAKMLQDPILSLAAMQGLEQQAVIPDITVTDGQTLTFFDTKIKVMITKGHTEGSAVYFVDDVCFSGDTLFCSSIGRTDFPGGSTQKMIASLKRLKSIDTDYRLLSGHGEESTLFYEKQNNYFLVSI